MSRPDLRLLREVSRSFYLSIRVLPRPMRGAVALAYLLARASDTLADTPGVAPALKRSLLEGFAGELGGGDQAWRDDLGEFRERQEHAGERALIGRMVSLFDQLAGLPDEERTHVTAVATTIISGQRLDVERSASGQHRMPDADSLEDYCHRVAGCVGLFWTRIGFATLGARFSRSDPGELEAMGERFGRGLQLVNILRDLPGDLEQGRCYLPAEPKPDAILVESARWREVARARMDDGLNYARRLRTRRLRIAVALPALLGIETLDRLDAADWSMLQRGVKVTRRTVRMCFWKALGLSRRGTGA
ncbi:phytoene/squalene synthase family protein [Haloferula sp. A504]|uniref:phytoene/squalene synthase family protein n=1 Tax=Haloferula sp. A504 TaxID=3373601 RepID=UPI0031BC03CA|nr:squalene/phytoene synthase family protein [Verrucomicrobiaceae bacterium E54]